MAASMEGIDSGGAVNRGTATLTHDAITTPIGIGTGHTTTEALIGLTVTVVTIEIDPRMTAVLAVIDPMTIAVNIAEITINPILLAINPIELLSCHDDADI